MPELDAEENPAENGKGGCESILIIISTAVPLMVRDINRAHLSTTIIRMDAGVEPPWMVSRRVVGGCARFMSRIKVKQD